ncbi:MAG: hypothetical protein ABI587_06135 [Gemmatimonadales bacterium]
MRALTVGLLLLVGGLPLRAQQRPGKPPRPAAAGCKFQLERTGGLGTQSIIGADTNYYAGGGVVLVCSDSSARIASDSVALYGRGANTLVQFIGHVRYKDSLTIQTSNFGTYYRTGERWEARGNVNTENLQNGSTIIGPSLDYFRLLPGVRDTLELFAVNRPTITYATEDSAGGRGEPYLIVADRVRMKGNNRVWAAGNATVNRSDFAAKGDSLLLNTGTEGSGSLIGTPEMRGLGRDSFSLRGRRIDLTLERNVLTYVKALQDGHAVTKDVDLVADTIGLDLEKSQLVQTLAWGDSTLPRALTADYEIRGDSLAFDTPARRLTEVRSFAHAWVGGAIDSTSSDRDWMKGDTIVARFTSVDSAGVARTTLTDLTATGKAHSWYRVSDRRGAVLPSINYSRGDRIRIEMKPGGKRGVDQVDIRGNVDGVHLEPTPVSAPDTTAAATPPKQAAR